MAQFQPGQSGHPSGRPPRKKPIKQRVELLTQKILDKIEQEIEGASAEERRKFFIEMVSVVMPTKIDQAS
jgi:hypothetical protein